MRRFPLLLLLLLSGVSLVCRAQNYEVDSSRSEAKFYIRHFAETVEGTFDRMSGNISYNAADVTKSNVRIAIKVSSVNTHSWQRDRHLQGDEFFDAGRFPEMVFASRRIEKRASGYVAVGNFTMRGTTKTIEIPFTVRFDPGGSRVTIQGTTSLNRRDYGVGSEEMADNQITVGNEVRIELNVQATRK